MRVSKNVIRNPSWINRFLVVICRAQWVVILRPPTRTQPPPPSRSLAAAVVTSPGHGAAAAVVPLKTYSSCLKVILCQILHDTSSLQHVGGGVWGVHGPGGAFKGGRMIFKGGQAIRFIHLVASLFIQVWRFIFSLSSLSGMSNVPSTTNVSIYFVL